MPRASRVRRPPVRYSGVSSPRRRQRQATDGPEDTPSADARTARMTQSHTVTGAPVSATPASPIRTSARVQDTASRVATPEVELGMSNLHLQDEQEGADVIGFLRHRLRREREEHDEQMRREREEHCQQIREILANATNGVTTRALPAETLQTRFNPSEAPNHKPPRFTRTFDGTSNYQTFHTLFRTTAERRNWTVDDQLDILMNALTGPAAEIVDEVAETGTLTYATLNAALMRVYGAKKAHDELEREFQAVKQEDNETPRTFAMRIDRAGRKAMRGFPEDRIQSALKKAFLLGLQDRAQAAMLNVTNAETLLTTISRSHAELTISSVIEPLMKRAKVHRARVELPQSSRPEGADQGTLTPAAAGQKRNCMSNQRVDRRPPKTTEKYTKQEPSSGTRTNEQYRRTIRCYACKGNYTIRNRPEFN